MVKLEPQDHNQVGGQAKMYPRLKHFGWGREGEGLTLAEEAFVLGRVEQRFGPAER
jgi:hypothetical protein